MMVLAAGSIHQCIGQHGAGEHLPSVCYQRLISSAVPDDGGADVAHEELDVVVLIDVKHQV